MLEISFRDIKLHSYMIWNIPHQIFTFFGSIYGTLSIAQENALLEPRAEEPRFKLREAYMNSHLASVSIM